MKNRTTNGLQFLFLSIGLFGWPCALPAIQITEIMYHPQTNEAQNEWVEIFNETSSRRDLSNWEFAEGIDYVFPPGTVLEPGDYLVIAINPVHIKTQYAITNVLGPFGGRLNNSSDHIILYDNVGGIAAEVDYEDDGKWPVAPDGAGHSLAKLVVRGDPMDPDNWRASTRIGGTPGRDNGFAPWTEDLEIISSGDTWRYFKGITEASTPIDAWRQIGFDDSAWLEGPTGIGYGDNDDATLLDDMQNNYLSVFCRKTFNLADPAAIDRLVLSIRYDDGFVAYLNGTEVQRQSMSTAGDAYYNTPATLHEAGGFEAFDLSAYKHLLVAGPNVLAVQGHNANLTSSDFTFDPKLLSRTLHTPAERTVPVVINEVRFYTSGTQYIELYNTGATSFDIGGYYLSNDPDIPNRFQVSAPHVIPASGHTVFLRSELGFAMSSLGDRILLTSPSLDVVVDARVVEAGPLEMNEGRWPDGADEWYYMQPTTGTANAVALTTSVVINEIMYHPPTELDEDEFIELYNAGTDAVDLAGWRFSRGIDFDFTTGPVLAAGAYLVVAKDRARLISRYGLDPSIVLGNYSGRLGNAGEKVRLRDANNNVADEVRYYDDGRWPKFADGYGSSLELIDPRQDNTNHLAWAPSDETAGSHWTTYAYSAVVETPADVNEHEIHFNLMGPGVVLIDNLELHDGTTQYLENGGFENGTDDWLIMGNHIRSHVTTEDAYEGSRCLKIVASGGGDPGANHIEQTTDTPMPSGQTYTIRFAARWLWGNPVLNTRCWNNEIPDTQILPTPTLTGTPGARNSASRPNMGPVFSSVRHKPVIPGAGDPVTITARIVDPDGVTSAVLHYRADADAGYSTVALSDDGLHDDGRAGDGVYGAIVPTVGSTGQTVAFYLEGVDGLGESQTWPGDPAKPALYRTAGSPLSSNFHTYRMIMTASDYNEFFNRPHLSNEPMNCTFIFDERDIYYQCGIRFTGSPYSRGNQGYRGYKITFNDDEKLHGVKWQARFDQNQNGGYRDRLSYHMLQTMRLPYCPTEFFEVRLNDRAEGIHEDVLPPGRRFLDMFYRGDDDGQLIELAGHYRMIEDVDTDFYPFDRIHLTLLDLGDDKDEYRWFYRLRNYDRQDDYASLIALVQRFGSIPAATTESEVGDMIDVLQWLRGMAVRSVNADRDFVGTGSSKNAYIYRRPSTGKWDLLHWDCELAFSDATLGLWATRVPQVREFQQFAGHEHYFYNNIHEYMSKYFTHAYMDPWIDYYYSLVGGYNADSCKAFITDRRDYVQGQLDPYIMPNVNIAITSPDPVPAPERSAVLEGTAPVNASWVRVNGRDYWLGWTDATHWFVTIQARPGTHVETLEFLDYDKQRIDTASITIEAPELELEVEDWKAY